MATKTIAKEVNNGTKSKQLREFRRDVCLLSAGFVLIRSPHNWLERSGSAGGAGRVTPQSLDMGQASGKDTQTHLLELPDIHLPFEGLHWGQGRAPFPSIGFSCKRFAVGPMPF